LLRHDEGKPGDDDAKQYNEFSLISEGAFDCLSLPFSFRKDEICLIPSQTKARALNEPVKPIQVKVQLVVHPVGAIIPKAREESWECLFPLWNVRSGLAAFPPFQSQRACKEALGFASSPL
jgi:hypothetical protein